MASDGDDDKDESAGLIDLDMGQFGSGTMSDPLRHAMGMRSAQDAQKMRLWNSWPTLFQNTIFHGEQDPEIKSLRHGGDLESRVQRANELKEQGNALVKSGDPEKAIENYEKAAGILRFVECFRPDWKNDDGSYKGIEDEWLKTDQTAMEGDTEEATNARSLVTSCYLNIALAAQKKSKWEDMMAACNEVLSEMDPTNVKALYRRAQARVGPTTSTDTDLDVAIDDLCQAARQAPQDKAVRELLAQLKSEKQSQKQVSRNQYAGLFERGKIVTNDPALEGEQADSKKLDLRDPRVQAMLDIRPSPQDLEEMNRTDAAAKSDKQKAQPKSKGKDDDEKDHQRNALKSETIGKLRKDAQALGAHEDEVDNALDCDDPKAALIELIVFYQDTQDEEEFFRTDAAAKSDKQKAQPKSKGKDVIVSDQRQPSRPSDLSKLDDDDEKDEGGGLINLDMKQFGSGSMEDPLKHAMAMRSAQDSQKMRQWNSWPSLFQNTIFHGEQDADVKTLRHDGSLDARITRAKQLKEEGNQLLKSGDYDKAVERYEKGAGILRYVHCVMPDWKNNDGSYKGIEDRWLRVDESAVQGDTDEHQEARSTVCSCYLNIALAAQKQENWSTMLGATNEILSKVDPQNVKALFRRAQARCGPMTAQDVDRDNAIADLTQAAKLAPHDRAVRELLTKMKEERKAQEKAERNQFSGLFDRGAVVTNDPRQEGGRPDPSKLDIRDPKVQAFLDITPGPRIYEDQK